MPCHNNLWGINPQPHFQALQLYNKCAVLEWLLARAGRFADEAAEHRYLNQLRTSAGAFDHIISIQ